MSNYNKSFNFRNGVQVDTDDLIVRGSLVGIGTTIPRADLDVRGTVDVTGIITTSALFVSGISTFTDEIHIGAGITISPQLGIISATFRGDASQLDNLPTSQWVDVDPGLGYTSIYNVGPVGVGTTNPLHTFQVGGSPDNPLHAGVGIDSTRGNIKTTGIVTAASFVGSGAGITAINASNIIDGTLNSARFPAIIDGRTEVGTVNLVASGVGTVSTINATTGTVTNLNATNVNVTGITTLGVTTFTGGVNFGSDLLFGDNIVLRIGDATNGDLRLYHNGSDSYIQDSGDGNLILRGDDAIILEQTDGSEKYAQFNKAGSVELYYDNSKKFETLGYGATVTGELKVSNNATVLGVSTLTSISASDATIGVATVTELSVTEFFVQNVTTTGVSTFSAAIDANAGATIDNIQIGIANDNEIDTVSGGITIDSNSGQTTVDDNLSVTGVATVTGTVTLTGGAEPDTDLGSALGSNSKYFSAAYINQINVGVAGTNEISTREGTLVLDSEQGTVVIDDNLSVTGVSTFADVQLVNEIVPDTDQGSSVGSSSLRFAELYVDNIRIGVGSDQEIIANTGNLELKAPSGTVNITNFNPVGVVTFNGDILPNADKTLDLGSASEAYAQAHVDEIRIGNSANTIDTRSGDLILDSFTNNVNLDSNVQVSNRLSAQEDLYVGAGGTGFSVLGTDQNVGIGTSIPTSAVQVIKYSAADVQLVSTNATSSLTLSRSIGITNDSASVSYNGTDLEINNKDAGGNISVNLATGTGINTSSDFKVTQGGNDLLVVSHEGFTGINKAVPTKALDITGDLLVSQDAKVVGVLTVGTGGNEVTLGSGLVSFDANINGNVNSTGVSTFTTITAQDFDTDDIKVTVGVATFMTGATLGTDATSDLDISDILLTVEGSAVIKNNLTIYEESGSSIGVGTTAIPGDGRTGYGNLRPIDYGRSFVRGNIGVLGDTSGTAIFVPGLHDKSSGTVKYIDTRSIDDHTYQFSVGVNTHIPRSCMDLGGSSSPLILPSINATALGKLVNTPSDATINDTSLPAGSGQQVLGALYYDTVDSCARLGISTNNSSDSFVRIVHVSTSGSIEAIAFPQVNNTQQTTLANDANIPLGSVVFNTTAATLRVKTSSGTFTDLH